MAEMTVNFLTNPIVAPILLTVGIAGVIIEIMTPGFGAAGIIGGSSLILYFTGHIMAGFFGWGVLLLFLAGVILMIVEAMIPGFGAPGILGLLCFLASIVLVAPSFEVGIRSLVIALLGSIVLIFLALRFFGVSKFWSRLSLRLSLGKEEGYISQKEDFTAYVGRIGKTATALRPAGFVVLDDGKRLDVVSEGGFIEKDQTVTVIRAEGPMIFVSVDTPPPPQD
ncbi:MAG: hypothetical protein FWH55_10120 [Oscillospiraceae bacterium]|nr:hypothetical protein [Oscillospiraceae bacterium]